jgi:hypothetical protein
VKSHTIQVLIRKGTRPDFIQAIREGERLVKSEAMRGEDLQAFASALTSERGRLLAIILMRYIRYEDAGVGSQVVLQALDGMVLHSKDHGLIDETDKAVMAFANKYRDVLPEEQRAKLLAEARHHQLPQAAAALSA